MFLLLYTLNSPLNLFAWSSGDGDVAVGLFAIVIVAHVNRDRNCALSRGYHWAHYFGLLDFVIAVGTATLSSGAFQITVSGGATSTMLDIWFLNLVSNFIIPTFVVLQLAILLNVREIGKQQAR